MKIHLSLVHLITLGSILIPMAAAQSDLPKAQIVNLNVDPQNVTVLHLRRGYVSCVRLPEAVSSVVLGDPGGFKAEHSEADPQLVFLKPTSAKPAKTNAVITTITGREISLTLISEGSTERSSEEVDYVVRYNRPRSFLVGAAHSSFVIGDTKSLSEEATAPTSSGHGQTGGDEEAVLRQEKLESAHWEGKQLRVAVGSTSETGERMTVGFSVFNSSSKIIELLPPQVQLAGTSKNKHGRTKAEPVPIKDYQMTTRRLEPGTRADGVVVFERPNFKESRERLLLQVAQAEEVDRPVLVPIAFVAGSKGAAK
jgi:hypothetical protein